MQKDIKRNSLKSKLKEELEWYTYASDEEYDEKAVESILYLLDRWEPLEEGTVPPVEESWKRFLKIADRKELLPVEDADVVLNAARRKDAPVQEKEQGEKAAAGQRAEENTAAVTQTAEQTAEHGEAGDGEQAEISEQRKAKDEEQADIAEACRGVDMRKEAADRDSMAVCGRDEKRERGQDAEEKTESGNNEEEKAEVTGKTAGDRKIRKLARFASRHKIIASAVLVLMVLMVGNTIHAVANPETGFFFWMKRDDSGVKMITSPVGLDDKVDRAENIFYDKEDAPEWAQGWLEIEEEIEMPENYEWLHFEANELDNRKGIAGHYWNDDIGSEIVLGTWMYIDEIVYGKEGLVGYDHILSYDVSQKQMDVYRREEAESVFFILCFYEGNSQYYIRGQDDLEELQILIEEYLECVNKF